MQSKQLHNPLDMHLHFRQDDMLKLVAPITAKQFSAGIIMPNTVPPIISKDDVIAYRQAIDEACKDLNFQPLMTVFFHQDLNFETLQALKPLIHAIKLYPQNITTNSSDGIAEVLDKRNYEIFQAMSDLDLILCIHGESTGFVMDREHEFLSNYEQLAKDFPKLKIIMEHISDRRSLDLLERYDNLYATVTLHHLIVTLDDLAGGMLKPHLFCKPIVKRSEDQKALLKASFAAHPKLCFGSDSAPHPISSKESECCAAGVFSAPVALAKLTELFDENQALDNLQAFVSDNAVRIYELKNLPQKTIKLVKKTAKVDQKYNHVLPFLAGQHLKWQVVL